jgi:hypothetical protein
MSDSAGDSRRLGSPFSDDAGRSGSTYNWTWRLVTYTVTRSEPLRNSKKRSDTLGGSLLQRPRLCNIVIVTRHEQPKMAAPKPHLRIREATPADATTLAEIHFAAFGPDIINQLLFPGGITEDAKAKAAYWIFPPPDRDPKPATSERRILVAELVPEDSPADAPGEIVAFAKWSLRRKPIPEEQWNAEPPIEADMLGEGSNIEVYKWFNGTLHRRFRQIARGDPMLCR